MTMKLIDKLVEDYPQYYQLRMWSGDIKNGLQDPFPVMDKIEFNENFI